MIAGRKAANLHTKPREDTMDHINRDEIVRETEEYGKQWGINHTRRLLHIIEIIGEGLEYNQDAVWLAAHLHDWGDMLPGRKLELITLSDQRK